MTEKNGIAETIAALDATGRIGELVAAKRGNVDADEAREAIEELMASEPGAARSLREAFLAWPAERQEAAIGALGGSDAAARRTWSRLLFGIAEGPDGKVGLA